MSGRLPKHLAADKLVDPTTSDSTLTASASTDATFVDSLLCASLHRVLPPIAAMTGCRRGPTPKTRLLGPYDTPPPNAAIEGTFNALLIPPKLTLPQTHARYRLKSL
ncbi:hypothetical protein JVT61DRAFT_11791 [Boletus reticuloceps]|uniref:Uncharacterized protein n=1 Tax=Boletus reticuloceps TaxID=495285 RepID=A0A8I2YX85_9AGAM|nr:hypothetical protein JVT61DRAFT_11791 [Boletus reticuloceps]